MKLLTRYLLILLLFAGGLISCKKDKTFLTVQPSKWEIISGNYKVYDTTGVYLYDMKISHCVGIDTNGNKTDSLRFENLDGQFSFGELQSNIISESRPKTYFDLGSHNPIKDTANKRWVLFGPLKENTNYVFNDSITFSLSKNNILYFISDITPYRYVKCKQIAVKQH